MIDSDIVPLDKRTPGIGRIDPLIRPMLPELYARRAARLLELAGAGHEDADYLRFASTVVQAQAALLSRVPLAPSLGERMPELHGDALDEAAVAGDEAIWRTLDALLEALSAAGVEPAVQERINALRDARRSDLAAQALALLQARYGEADARGAVLLWAALSLVWAQRAEWWADAQPPQADDVPPMESAMCPVCASAPVGSLILTGDRAGLRYLQCALCESRWHMVRAKCSNCDSAAKLEYLSLDREDAPVKAESCGDCGGYLKAFYLEREPELDMVADDLATLALDDAVGGDGFQRTGLNPFALPG